jgi:Zinc carboxypeptidase
MGTRTWAPGSPEYLYHVYDDPIVTAAFTKARKPDIIGLGGGVDPKWVYSLKKDMDALRAYGVGLGIVDPVATLGTAAPDGNDLMVLKVGTGTAHPVLFAGCHHAREWISVEIPYLVAEYLIRKYKANPTTPQEKRIKHLLMNRQITFVPLVNPNGHRYTFTTERNWRPNRMPYTAPSAALPSTAVPNPPLMAPQYGGGPPRAIRYPDGVYQGVDINRNYPTAHWGEETTGTSRDPTRGGTRPGASTSGQMVWCGPSAGSEPETQLMMALGAFRSVISYHNYWEVIFYPDAALHNVFVEWVGNGMITLIAQPPGHTYRFWNNSSTADPSNYLTTGELIDYAYEHAPNRPAFTPELRPRDDSAGWGFSGLPELQIEPCFLENLPAALALINCAGHDAVAANQTAGVATGSPPTKCQLVRHCWEVFRGWTP